MNLPENVIRDLLPVYHSGEASDDTRKLIETYLAEHPELERDVRSGDALSAFDADQSSGAPDETVALRRTKRVLRWQQVLLGIASTLTLNTVSLGFSFETGNGQLRVHWLTLPGQAQLIAIAGILSVISWIAYFRVGKHIRRRILR
jgi:anti-sigma factor RsiW